MPCGHAHLVCTHRFARGGRFIPQLWKAKVVQNSEASWSPSAEAVSGIVSLKDYEAFAAGWEHGLTRNRVNPCSPEVVDELASMFEVRARLDRLTAPE